MTSLSSLLSSINPKPQTSQQVSSQSQKPRHLEPACKPNDDANSIKLTSSNAAAGVKRKSAEPESSSQSKAVKTVQATPGNRPSLSNRFQLSARSDAIQRALPVSNRPAAKPVSSSRAPSSQTPASTSTPIQPSTADGRPPPKRGFASIMERAKAAQEAAKANGPSTIRHRPVEKLSRRERRRLMEEQAAQQKASTSDRTSQTGVVSAKSRFELAKTGRATGLKSTPRKPEPLSYKGTMRSRNSSSTNPDPTKKKPPSTVKHNDYVDWSDLDDVEDDNDDEEAYDSGGSSDMEGGFDDVEQEESLALRAARKEDQAALEEEERHQREKAERRRKLEMLSKSAAARKKY